MRIEFVKSFTVGKTVVTFTAEGCVDCGAKEAEAAVEADYLMFRMGDRKYGISFKRCPACHMKRYGNYGARQLMEAQTNGAR